VAPPSLSSATVFAVISGDTFLMSLHGHGNRFFAPFLVKTPGHWHGDNHATKNLHALDWHPGESRGSFATCRQIKSGLQGKIVNPNIVSDKGSARLGLL
jgi:hypothetical protein